MDERTNSLQAMMDQGFEQLQAGCFENSIDAFTACLAVYPEAGKAVLGRAVARFQIKDWKGAQQDFQRATDLVSDDPESWLGLGLSLAMQSEIYPAFEVLEKLLVRFPNFVRGYMQLGMLHIKIGAIPKGRGYLEQALQHRPSLVERRQIETTLNEQATLDHKRYYRPDFEALRKQKPA